MRTTTHAVCTRPFFSHSVLLEKKRPGDEARECPKCFLVQLEEDGKTCYMGSLIVDIGGKRVDVRAYDQVLAGIAGVGAECVTAKGLLRCGCFDMVYKDGIIRSAKHK